MGFKIYAVVKYGRLNMALLKPSQKPDKTQVRINIDTKTVEMANAYCDFAGIKKLDEFFEKAAEFVMKKDKSWKAHSISPPVAEKSSV